MFQIFAEALLIAARGTPFHTPHTASRGARVAR